MAGNQGENSFSAEQAAVLGRIPDGSRLLVMDADGTIYRDSIFLKMFEKMESAGLVDKADSEKIRKMNAKWKDRETNYEEYLASVLGPYFAALGRIRYKEYFRIWNEVISETSKRTYLFPLHLAEKLKKQGFRTMILSGSCHEAVTAFSKKHGFDYAIGTSEEFLPDGKFSGKRTLLARQDDKRRVLSELRKKRCVVYGMGDTNGDFSLVLESDYGYALNPNAELYGKISEAVARDSSVARRVSVVTERKDLVLEFRPLGSRNGSLYGDTIPVYIHPKQGTRIS